MIYPNFQEDYYLCNEKGQIPLWEPALLLINNIGLSESYWDYMLEANTTKLIYGCP